MILGICCRFGYLRYLDPWKHALLIEIAAPHREQSVGDRFNKW